MECRTPTDKVIFHIQNLDIDNSSIVFDALDSDNGPKFTSWSNDYDRHFFVGQLSSVMETGRKYSIEMTFSARLRKALSGLYLSDYKKGNNKTM